MFDSNSCLLNFSLILLFGIMDSVLDNHNQDTAHGPCFMRRTRLPRLGGVEIGHVQYMQLTPSGDPHVVRTLSVNPPIFEILDFLSHSECSHLIKVAQSHVMEPSDIYQSDAIEGNHGNRPSFSEWDLNGDRLLDYNEIYQSLVYLRDIHLTQRDIRNMCKKLRIGRLEEGYIHPREFKGAKIMRYIDKLIVKKPSIKGRQSNNTWLDTWEDDVMKSLNIKKAALTGLPLEVIQGSESPTIIRYGPGGHYHCHFDSHSHDSKKPCCDQSSVSICRSCRYVTIMYYLNDVTRGGQTAFPFANSPQPIKDVLPSALNVSNLSAHCSKANLVVTPNKGKAVMWYNHVIDKQGMVGDLDRASFHGGCNVIEGEKWIMNNWINVFVEDFEHIRTWYSKMIKT